LKKVIFRRLARVHPDHRRIARGAFRVAVFLMLAKAVGAVKEMTVAWRYGVSDVVDAYQFTMTMASWLPTMLVGVLSVVLIPVLVKLRRERDEERQRFLRELRGASWLLAAALAALTWFAWPFVLHSLGKGLSSATRAMTTELLTGFALVAALTLLGGISAARLRASERHINTLLDSMPALAVMASVLWLTGTDEVTPLLWGTLAGFVLQAFWLSRLAASTDAVRHLPCVGWSSPHWPTLMRAAGVMVIGQVAMSFAGPLDQYTAAQLGSHANATLGYATRLLSLALGLGAASVGRAALPVLADVQRSGDAARARAMALKWSVLMGGAGLATAALGGLLAPWLVALLFERGAFTAQHTGQVAEVLRWGLLQLPFYFGVLILVQLLASQNRYRIMAMIAVANFALKAVMNPLLASVMGAPGIMLATSLMYALSYVCYTVVASRPLSAEQAGKRAAQ